jgi:hypothetical protein
MTVFDDGVSGKVGDMSPLMFAVFDIEVYLEVMDRRWVLSTLKLCYSMLLFIYIIVIGTYPFDNNIVSPLLDTIELN